MSTIDVLVLIEQPYITGLVELAKSYGVMVCLIPMMEWMKESAPWLKRVDMIWAPTRQAFLEMSELGRRLSINGKPCPWADHIYGGRWGVRLDEFEFRPRESVESFLFANGNGGIFGRKGAQTLAAAARRVPDARIVFTTQTDDFPRMPANVEVVRTDFARRGDVYAAGGDVFLAPTYWEGLGHQLYEAQACGLPLMVTDGEPMDQAQGWRRIPVELRIWQDLHGKRIIRHCPDAAILADLVAQALGQDISQASRSARQFIESGYSLDDTLAQLGETIGRRLDTFRASVSTDYGGGDLADEKLS